MPINSPLCTNIRIVKWECVTWLQLINRLILGKEGKNYRKICCSDKGWDGGATVSQMAVRMKWRMALLRASTISVKSTQKGTEQKATFQRHVAASGIVRVNLLPGASGTFHSPHAYNRQIPEVSIIITDAGGLMRRSSWILKKKSNLLMMRQCWQPCSILKSESKAHRPRKTLSFKNWLKPTQFVTERGLCILGPELAAKLYKLHRLITIIKPWIEEENSIYLRLTLWNFNKESIDIRWAFPSNDISKPTKNKQINKEGPSPKEAGTITIEFFSGVERKNTSKKEMLH